MADGHGEHLALAGVEGGIAASAFGAEAEFLEVGNRGSVDGVDERTSETRFVVGKDFDGLLLP